MHKFELEVWKAIYTHILCVLYAVTPGIVQDLNARCIDFFNKYLMVKTEDLLPPIVQLKFQQVPTFGRGTIRQFLENISSLGMITAQKYADILMMGH